MDRRTTQWRGESGRARLRQVLMITKEHRTSSATWRNLEAWIHLISRFDPRNDNGGIVSDSQVAHPVSQDGLAVAWPRTLQSVRKMRHEYSGTCEDVGLEADHARDVVR